MFSNTNEHEDERVVKNNSKKTHPILKPRKKKCLPPTKRKKTRRGKKKPKNRKARDIMPSKDIGSTGTTELIKMKIDRNWTKMYPAMTKLFRSWLVQVCNFSMLLVSQVSSYPLSNSTSILSSDGSVNETTDSSTAKNEEMEDFSLSSMMNDDKYEGGTNTGSRETIITVSSVLPLAFLLGTILITTILIICRKQIRRCFRNSNGNVRTQAGDPNVRQNAIQLENLNDQGQEEHEMFSNAVPNTSSTTADLSGHRKEKQVQENKAHRKSHRELDLHNGTEMAEVVRAGDTKELLQVVSLNDDDYGGVLEDGTVNLEFSQPLTPGGAIRSFGVLVQSF